MTKHKGKIRELDRLSYDEIQEYHNQGIYLCPYVRNPMRAMTGECALNQAQCKTIMGDHKSCRNCIDYYREMYGVSP